MSDLITQRIIDEAKELLQKEKGLIVKNDKAGAGAFGRVMFVEDVYNNSIKYALKLQYLGVGEQYEENLKSYQYEAQTMRECKHKNVVEIHSDYILNSCHIIQMNLCQQSLEDWVVQNKKDNRKIGDMMFAHYVNQIIDGIDYLHKLNYVLRDFSLSNILLTAEGVVKLCDFGMVKKINPVLNALNKSSVDGPQGKPIYMAPENTLDENNPQTKAGDIWALGICLAIMGGADMNFAFWQVFKYQSLEEIKNEQIVIPQLKLFSQKAGELVTEILKYDPFQRPTIQQVREKVFQLLVSHNPEMPTDQSDAPKFTSSFIKANRTINFNFAEGYQLLEKYQKQLGEQPDNLDSIISLGFIEAQYSSKMTEAKAYFEKAIELNSQEIDAYLGLVYCIIKAGEFKNYSNAFNYLETCINLKEDYWRTYFYKALLLFYKKNYKECMENYEKGYKLNPEAIELSTIKMLLSALYLKDITETTEQIKFCNQNNKLSNPFVFWSIGYVYDEFLQNKQHAVNFYQQARKFSENDLRINLSLAYCYFSQNKNDEGQNMMLRVQYVYPDNSLLTHFLSNVEQDPQNKLDLLHLAIQQDSENIYAYHDLAQHYLREKKPKESLEQYEIVLQLHHDDEVSLYQIGYIYGFIQNEFKKAEEFYKKVIQFYPQNKKYYFELVDIYKKQNDVKNQQTLLVDYLDIFANDAQAYGMLAQLSKQQNDTKKYFSYLQEFIRNGGECNEESFYELGCYSLQNNNQFDAQEYLQKVYQMNPNYKNINLLLARLETNPNKKADFLNREIKCSPDCHESYHSLGTIYYQQKQYDQSIQYYSKAISLNKNNFAYYYNISVVYKFLGKLDLALQNLLSAKQLNQNDIDIYINLGDIYKQQQKHNDAIQTYKKVMELNPKRTEFNEQIAQSYEAKKEIQFAIDYYEKHVQSYPQAFNSLYSIGYHEQTFNKNIEKALQYYQRSIKASPKGNSKNYRQLGLIYKDQNKSTLSRDHLLQAIEISSTENDLYLELAILEKEKLSDIYKAITYLEKYLQFFPSESSEKLKLADWYFENKQNDKARQMYLIYQKEKPNDYKGFFYLGQLEFEEKKFLEAIKQYQQSVELNTTLTAGLYNIGQSYQQLNEYAKSINTYKKAIQIDQTYQSAYHQIGYIEYSIQNNPKRAIRYLRKAIELDNNDAYSYNFLGECFKELKYTSEAVEAFRKTIQAKHPAQTVLDKCEKFIKENQNAPVAKYKQTNFDDSDSDTEATVQYKSEAEYNISIGQYQEAIKKFNLALQRNQKSTTFERLGFCYLQIRQFDKALEMYNNVLERKPTRTEIYHQLAEIYEGLNQPMLALENYKRHLQYHPNSHNSYFKLAVYEQILNKNVMQSIEYYKKAIELNPKGNSNCYRNLGAIYHNQSNFQDAYDCFMKAIELNENQNKDLYDSVIKIERFQFKNPLKAKLLLEKQLSTKTDAKDKINLIMEIASIENEQKNYKYAIQRYQEILQFDQNHILANFNIALGLQSLQDYKQAIEQLQKVIKIDPNYSMAYYQIGHIQQNGLKKPKKAIKFLRRSIELNSNHVDSHYQLGQAFNDRGYKWEAVCCYQKVLQLSGNYIAADFCKKYISDNQNAKQKSYKKTNVEDSDCNIF